MFYITQSLSIKVKKKKGSKTIVQVKNTAKYYPITIPSGPVITAWPIQVSVMPL